jgi:microcystin-dependent protein
MSGFFLSEIRVVSFDYAPNGWAECNGQLLPINQNQALFALLGTTYGGDGQTTFALPDLRGRVPMHVGGGHDLGERAGEQAHTLSSSEAPTHTHQVNASNSNANANAASAGILAVSQGTIYLNPNQTSPNLTTLNTNTVGNVGGSQAHVNMQPYLTLTFIIALQGIFPSRN